VAFPVVGHEDGVELGMADEVDAVEVVRLALGKVRAPGYTGVSDGTLGSAFGTWQITRMRRCGCATDSSPRFRTSTSTRRRVTPPSRRWSVAVTSSTFVNCCSSRRNVATSANTARSTLHDGLGVAAVEARAGNLSTIRGRDLVVGISATNSGDAGLQLALVHFFTSVRVVIATVACLTGQDPAGTAAAVSSWMAAPPVGDGFASAGATRRSNLLVQGEDACINVSGPGGQPGTYT